MSKPHLVLLDGHHLLYRAYWAIPRTLKTRSGEQTNISFGVASMLLHILKIEQPDAIIMAFDEGNETFRHQENETYKDGRADTPDDFYPQVPRVFSMIDAMGIAQVSDAEYEADDYLASYAKAGEKAGMRVTIVSGDRDVFQLANDSITVAIPHKGYQQAEYCTAAVVQEKFGVRPDQVAAYKGLCGDSSDNLPGVRGIGPKTAAELLQKYETLDGIYAHLQDIRPSVQEKLQQDKQQAYFCERMAELVLDVPLPLSLEQAAVQNMPSDATIQVLQELEFALLVKRFQALLDSPYGQSHFQASTLGTGAVEPASSQLTMF